MWELSPSPLYYTRKHIPQVDRADQNAFVGELRALLAGTCIDALEPDDAESRWADHVDFARGLIAGEVELGLPPADLADTLSLLALASPGNVAARSLARSGLGGMALENTALRTAAAEVAWGFRALFNQPEAMAIVRRLEEGQPYWKQVVEYAAAGCLQAVLDEYAHLVRDLEGWIDTSSGETLAGVADAVFEAVTLRTSTAFVDEIVPAADNGSRVLSRRIRNHFALRFATQRTEDDDTGLRIDRVRAAFNSPFWPFVLATTSFAQEGLDFHAYSHAVVHWNLPSNPVNLEQREGRVHRYKGPAVRKNLAERHSSEALDTPHRDARERLFELAANRADASGAAAHVDVTDGRGLRPYWVFPGTAAIERYVPRLPLSRDDRQYDALRRSLAVYRMVFGQPRQDDLMAFLLKSLGSDRLTALMPVLRIDLAPSASPW